MAGGNVPGNLAPIFVQAGHQYGIPANVLAGVASVETNLGQNRSTSSAGAQGLMQFMPGTAASLGVNPYNDRSSIFGAAKLLVQYGYHSNPLRALGAYNGGPGNPQYGYANQVMSEAARLKGQLPGNASASTPGPAAPKGVPGMGSTSISFPQTTTDQAGFQKAQKQFVLGQFLRQQGKSPWDIGPKVPGLSDSNPLLNLLPTTAPSQADFQKTTNQTLTVAQSSLQRLAGPNVLKVHPAVAGQTLAPGHAGGGFLPAGAKYIVGRKDQGRDGTTDPGGPIIAPGAGYVVSIKSDPAGFGPAYPVVHFTSGPYAGRTMYMGHTLAVVHAGQKFGPGTVLSHTGTHGVGNATVPGWFEIGFADGGSPGPMGQAVPF